MAKVGNWFRAKTGSTSEDSRFDGAWVASDGKIMNVSGNNIHGRTQLFATFTAKNADGCMIKTAGGKPFAASFGADGTLVWTDGDVWRRQDKLPSSAPDAMAGASAPPAGDEPAADAAAAQALAGGAPDLARAGWLAAEALRLEAQAKDNDRNGLVAEALLGYKRSAAKLVDAADCCPPDHPDREPMSDHCQDLTMRMSYLESLFGRAATEPVENHLPEDEGLAGKLTLDLSAEAPSDQNLASLVASTGVTGAAAPLSDEGLSLVTALGSGDEMRAFVRRVLDDRGLVIHDGSEPMGEFYSFTEQVAAGGGPRGLAQLQTELAASEWISDPVEEARVAGAAAEAERLRLEAEAAKASEEARAAQERAAEDARAAQERAEQEQATIAAAEAAAAARKELEKDKLNLAIVLEKEGKELEAQGRKPEALLKYITCSHAFKYVYDYDPRTKNSEKVKEMVRQRLENVVAECTRLKLEGVVAPAQ